MQQKNPKAVCFEILLKAMLMNMVDLAKICFCGWREKYKKDKRYCEGAYPARYVTKQNAKYFEVFFRQKSTR